MVFSSPRCPPTTPACSSSRISVLRACGTMSWCLSKVPSSPRNCRHSMPSLTLSCSHCCKSHLKPGAWPEVVSGFGLVCSSTAHRMGPMMGSSCCSCLMSSKVRPGRSCGCPSTVAMLTVIVLSDSKWLSLPHCRHGNLDSASALLCFLP